MVSEVTTRSSTARESHLFWCQNRTRLVLFLARYLKQVIVRDLKTKSLWVFDHNRWLFPDVKLRKVCATLEARDPDDKDETRNTKAEFQSRTLAVSSVNGC